MIDTGTYGAPNWVDLTSHDIDAAIAYYRDLFGWDIETTTSPLGAYHVAKIGDHEVGGLMQAGPELTGVAPMWTTFFHVASADATATHAAELGGQVLEPAFDIPGGARVAVVADPTGAVFAVIGGGPPATGVWRSDQPGAVCWVELMSRDPVAAEGFYTALFGWKARTSDHGGTPYTSFDLDEELVAGMLPVPEEVPAEAPSYWAVYFATDDCGATEQRAVELGGQALHPTTDLEAGRFAVLADPEGAVFSILEATVG